MSEQKANLRQEPRVSLGLNRCPYCHDDLEVAVDEWVSCSDCLARHHSACWSESGQCGSCGSTRSLSPRGPAELPEVRARALLLREGFPAEEVDRLLAPTRASGRSVVEVFGLLAVLGLGALAAGWVALETAEPFPTLLLGVLPTLGFAMGALSRSWRWVLTTVGAALVTAWVGATFSPMVTPDWYLTLPLGLALGLGSGLAGVSLARRLDAGDREREGDPSNVNRAAPPEA